MEKIKAYTRYNERQNKRYYAAFDIMDELPERYDLEKLQSDTSRRMPFDDGLCIGAKKIEIDCEQGADDVYNYNFYELKTFDAARYHADGGGGDIDEYCNRENVAVKMPPED